MVRTISEHIERTFGGKYLPKRYDWTSDPNGYLVEDGHKPTNRCFHCGFRFVGSQDYAVFCNICDTAMQIGGEEILLNFKTSRVNARIRIPDDTTEQAYEQKLKDIDVTIVLKTEFKTAKDLV